MLVTTGPPIGPAAIAGYGGEGLELTIVLVTRGRSVKLTIGPPVFVTRAAG
jgi:hypothetical protein